MVIDIAGRPVGDGHPCFVIAEAGVNHNGSPDLARQLIDAAAEAGADAVKFQSFHAEVLATASAPKAPYQVETTGAAGTQLEMLRALELDGTVFADLCGYCETRRIRFLSTPFDEESADMLAGLGVPAFKISSGELTNVQLLAHVARFGKPLIVSTGMASMSEVETAVRTVRAAGGTQLALLQCVSSYPAAPRDVNLRAMATLRATFGCPTGYSDHTDGIAVGLAAAALGACIIEKHLTLDRRMPGPDHRASLEPDAFRAFVTAIRDVEASLGDGCKRPVASEEAVALAARRSLVAARPIPQGTVLTASMLVARRPGHGITPAALADVVGRQTRRAIEAGSVLTWEMLQ